MATEWKNKGNTELQQGNPQNAISCFTEGLKWDSSNAILYSNRSAAYAQLKDWNSALSDADQAIQCKPDWSKGYSRKGFALFKLNRYESAIATYKLALQIEPNNADLQKSLNLAEEGLKASEQNVLGEEKVNKGKPSQGIPFFDDAIKRDPNNALYYCNRANAKNLCGYYDSALQDSEEVIRRRPDWIRGYQRRAEALYGKQQYNDAASVYAYALQLAPNDEKLTKAFNGARQEAYLQQKRDEMAAQQKKEKDSTSK